MFVDDLLDPLGEDSLAVGLGLEVLIHEAVPDYASQVVANVALELVEQRLDDAIAIGLRVGVVEDGDETVGFVHPVAFDLLVLGEVVEREPLVSNELLVRERLLPRFVRQSRLFEPPTCRCRLRRFGQLLAESLEKRLDVGQHALFDF